MFGYSAGAVVMAQNLVFVPLLALGCYGTAKVAFGREAGLLAALFAFAVPMVLSLFHQALPDAPLTAMVAVTVWLLLASDRFARPAIAAAAGVAAGLGMYTKGTFVVFIAGLVRDAAAARRLAAAEGLSRCSAGLAAVIAAPYFIDQFSAIEAQSSAASRRARRAALPLWYGNVTYPDRTSVENFTWYFWNLVNNQLYLPLTLFFLAGRRLGARPAPALAARPRLPPRAARGRPRRLPRRSACSCSRIRATRCPASCTSR